MTWIAIAAIVAVVVIFGALAASGILGNRSDTVDLGPTPDPIEPTKVVLETTAGNITIDLRVDKPITSTNFIDLVNAGEYDNTSFYRTVAGFVIQGGKGIMGGDLPEIRDEIGTNNRNTKYTIAMANHGVNSASSEFFINLVDNGQRTSGFDSKYTVFGTVIDGQDVVDMIANAPVTSDPSIMSGEESIPIDPVVILRATVLP
jgi:peptidyl-prolyl cis-trans isomerase A (cyclophilin A)